MNLKNLEGNSYYFQDYITVGFIKTSDKSGIVIDTGIDKNYSKKLIKEFDALGIERVDIINTHSHADHYGGNSFLKNKYNSKIYATKLEKAIIENPILEPIYLGYGASPIKELKNKFLMGEEANVDYIIPSSQGEIEIGNLRVGVIPLLGHSFEQVGIFSGEILYLGDTLLSEETLEKHKIPFLTDIGRYLETLENLKNMSFKYYVGAHLGVIEKEKLESLVVAHENKISEILNRIVEKVGKSEMISLSEVIKNILDSYSIKIENIPQYYLMQSTLVAFINYLHTLEKIKLVVKENILSLEKI